MLVMMARQGRAGEGKTGQVGRQVGDSHCSVLHKPKAEVMVGVERCNRCTGLPGYRTHSLSLTHFTVTTLSHTHTAIPPYSHSQLSPYFIFIFTLHLTLTSSSLIRLHHYHISPTRPHSHSHHSVSKLYHTHTSPSFQHFIFGPQCRTGPVCVSHHKRYSGHVFF